MYISGFNTISGSNCKSWRNPMNLCVPQAAIYEALIRASSFDYQYPVAQVAYVCKLLLCTA